MKSLRRTQPSSVRLRTTPVIEIYQITAAMSALGKLYALILTAGSQTIYRKRLQGMVIHSRHGDRDRHAFNKFSALRPD
jgi:hypothetical protein